MRAALATAWLAAILVSGFFLGFLTVAALAQSHHHPPQDVRVTPFCEVASRSGLGVA